MEKSERRLIRMGNTSLGIALPKSWLRYHDLKAGDKLDVTTTECVLIKNKEQDNGEV